MKFISLNETWKDSSINGNYLIIPDVSRGNVGQLTVDLLITTLNMQCIGFLDDLSVLPAVGWESGDGPDQGRICHNLEVYHSQLHRTCVVQQRAPVIQSQAAQFARRLTAWAQATSFSQLVFLSTLPADLMEDSRLGSPDGAFAAAAPAGPRRLAAICASSQVGSGSGGGGGEAARARIAELGWPTLEAHARGDLTAVTRVVIDDVGPSLSAPILALLLFCNEGDNVQDALEAAAAGGGGGGGSGVLRWRAPASWRRLVENDTARAIYT